MKKHPIILLLLSLILCFAAPVTSQATDDSQSFRYTLLSEGQSSVRVEAGQEVTVTVTLSRTDADEDWTMYAWQTEVAFDQNAFELVEGSVVTASGTGSSIHPGTEETRVYFNAYSLSRSGRSYPASREVGSFKLRAKSAGNYTIHNENYKVSTAGGQDRYRCDKADLTVSVAAVSVLERFGDVSADDWFADSVRFAVERGLFEGVSDAEFAPDWDMTRAMLVTVLHRLEGSPLPPASSGFQDVPPDAWFTDAVTWARYRDIVKGYSATEFRPDHPVSREQLATILYRYAEYKGYEVNSRIDDSRYYDGGAVSSWAAEAMSWANASGLIVGRTETTLNPGDTATRAEVATILMRFCRMTENG